MHRKVKACALGFAVIVALSGGLTYARDPCQVYRDLLGGVGALQDNCAAFGDCGELQILANELNCALDECENLPGGVCTAE